MWLSAARHLNVPFSIRRSLFPLLTGTIAFAVYLATLATDLTWAFQATDGPELMTAAMTLGVPHPPGYPTYVLLGHLFGGLPLGSIPFRFSLFSALSAGVAVVFLTAAARHMRRPEQAGPGVGAVAAVLSFALLAPVWQQAIVPEVYGLNLAFVAVLLWATVSRQPAPVSGLLFGLAMTTHGTSLLLLPLVLSQTPWRQWLRLAAAALLGMAPFLALPLLAGHGSPLVWGQPQRLDGWWWLVTAELYRPNLFALAPAEAAARLGQWLRTAQLALPALGLVASLPLLRRQTERRDGRLTLALALTALLYLLFAAFYRTIDGAVLLLPGLACAALLLLPLFHRLGPAGLSLPLLLLLLNFNQLNLHDDRSARVLAESVLVEAPPEAILLTEGDATTFTLWYLREVERQRPDLVVVDRNLFGFAWYRQQLADRHSWMPIIAQYDLEALTRLGRPICEVQFDDGLAEIDCGHGV